MAVGLKVWDSAGRLVFDPSTKISRWLATFNTGTSNGSKTFAWPNNTIAAIPVAYGNGIAPELSVNANIVSWSFRDSPVGDRAGATVIVIGY